MNVSGVAALPNGGGLVVGWFVYTSTFGPGEPNETTLTTDTYSPTVFVARYAWNGSLVWARHVGGSGEGWDGKRIAALSGGGALVTGRFGSQTATFGRGDPNETVLTSAGSDDIFVAKYNYDGTLGWVKRAGGPGSDCGLGVAAFSNGGAVATGYITDSASLGSLDVFVARYSPEGGLVWSKRG